MTCYEKRDHLGKMVVWNKINFYHDNVQLTFYKCSCEYTCISLQYITGYVQHATHYKQKGPNGPFSHSLSHIITILLLSPAPTYALTLFCLCWHSIIMIMIMVLQCMTSSLLTLKMIINCSLRLLKFVHFTWLVRLVLIWMSIRDSCITLFHIFTD